VSIEYCDDQIRWLSVDDLKDLNELMIISFTPKEDVGVLKPNELESSQGSPANYRYYKQCVDIPTLAAVLFYSISRNHVFMNGNKRTAMAAAVVFLRINGYRFRPDYYEGLIVAEDCAAGLYNELQIAQWIADQCTESDSADLVSDQMDVLLGIFKP
tara:strand:+ start:302 stop:772 length:471 start_codon:yes stop_codon:yes gene_type:complete